MLVLPSLRCSLMSARLLQTLSPKVDRRKAWVVVAERNHISVLLCNFRQLQNLRIAWKKFGNLKISQKLQTHYEIVTFSSFVIQNVPPFLSVEHGAARFPVLGWRAAAAVAAPTACVWRCER